MSSVEEEVTISKVEVLLFVSVAPVGKTIFVSLVDIAEVVVTLEKSDFLFMSSRVTAELYSYIYMFGVPGYDEVPGATLYCTWPGPLRVVDSHVTGEPGNPDYEKFHGVGISHFFYRDSGI